MTDVRDSRLSNGTRPVEVCSAVGTYLDGGLIRRLEEAERGRIAVPRKITPLRIPEVGGRSCQYTRMTCSVGGPRVLEATNAEMCGEDGDVSKHAVPRLKVTDRWTRDRVGST